MTTGQADQFRHQSRVRLLTKGFQTATTKLQDPNLGSLARTRAEDKLYRAATSSKMRKAFNLLDESTRVSHQHDEIKPRHMRCSHLPVIHKAQLLFQMSRPEDAEIALIKEIEYMEEKQLNSHGRLFLFLS